MFKPFFPFALLIFVGPFLVDGLSVSSLAAQQELDVKSIEPFELASVDGESIKIAKSDNVHYTIVAFVGTECPLVKYYGPVLQRLADKYGEQNVRVIGMGSNIQDSKSELADFASAHNLKFPIVKDVDNVVADQFGAERTPEVFLIDNQLNVRYRGRIDDQYLPGVARSMASRNDLQIALKELLAGNEVTTPRTKTQGCLIGRAKVAGENSSSKITYAGEVSKVFERHCVECHRAGEIGPFKLDNYDDAAGWAEMVVEVIDQGRMPPWHASTNHAKLSNARIMPEKDKQVLRDWLAAGVPSGDLTQLEKPETQESGWHLPKQPDLIVEMVKAFTVPAEGTVEYQYFVVDPGLNEDTWISAAEVVPGNRSVVHHSIVFVRAPDGSQFRGSGWLGAYVPGQGRMVFETGHARLVPAGSMLVFQQHYTPNGIKQSDKTKVGLVFIPAEEVTHEVITLAGIDQGFEIPPHAENHRVELSVPWLPDGGKLLSVAPHMHWRGKSFELFTRKGDERNQLVEVSNYDFNWQHSYRFESPVDLEKIDTLEFAVAFDNSVNNPANPDPTQYVMWGDQTWEEMAVAFFEVSRPLVPEESTADEQTGEASDQVVSESETKRSTTVKKMADDYLNRNDKNGDGIVEIEELSNAAKYGFWRIDWDDDGVLTRTEIEDYAQTIIDR